MSENKKSRGRYDGSNGYRDRGLRETTRRTDGEMGGRRKGNSTRRDRREEGIKIWMGPGETVEWISVKLDRSADLSRELPQSRTNYRGSGCRRCREWGPIVSTTVPSGRQRRSAQRASRWVNWT